MVAQCTSLVCWTRACQHGCITAGTLGSLTASKQRGRERGACGANQRVGLAILRGLGCLSLDLQLCVDTVGSNCEEEQQHSSSAAGRAQHDYVVGRKCVDGKQERRGVCFSRLSCKKMHSNNYNLELSNEIGSRQYRPTSTRLISLVHQPVMTLLYLTRS